MLVQLISEAKRYWRGGRPPIAGFLTTGFGLGATAWVFGHLLFAIDGFIRDGQTGVDVVVAELCFVCIIAPPTLLWWLVGSWRASSRQYLVAPNSWWPLIIKLPIITVSGIVLVFFLGVGLILYNLSSEIAGDPQEGQRGTRIIENGTTILVYGFLTSSVARQLNQALSSDRRIKTVQLESMGGRLATGIKIGEIVRNRKLNTLVVNTCISACALAFMGGYRRLIGRGAVLGFHGALFVRVLDKGENKRLRDLVVKYGASEQFAAMAFNSDVVWYPTVEQLRSNNVITGVISR